MGTTSTGEFDPSRVPPYPVITLTGADDQDHVTVDGAPIHGDDAYDQALALIASRAHELGGAVRVRGIDAHGGSWPMVVTSSGALYDLSSTQDPRTGSSRPRRRALLFGAGCLAAAALGVAGFFGYRSLSTPRPAAPPERFPGRGANLPVRPPAGIDAVATWAVLIDPGMTPSLLPQGRLLLATGDGNLVIVDQSTGQLQWTGRAGGAPSGRVITLTVDGTPALGVVGDDELSLWPLDDPNTPSAQTLAVEQGRARTVITSSAAPVWVLEEQTISYFAGDRLTLADVPVPAIPAGTHGTDAVAVDTQTWISISPDNDATAHSLDQAPGDAEPIQARVLGPDHLAVLWSSGDTSHLTLHRLPDGALVAELDNLPVPHSSNNDEPIHSPDTTAWIWHSVLIRPAHANVLTTLAALTLPDAPDDENPLQVETVGEQSVWGWLDGTAVRYDLRSDTLTADSDGDVTIPLGESTDAALAYIVATRLNDTSIYALASQHPLPAPASDGGRS